MRPLHAAVAARNLRAVQLVLDADADPDARQKGGYTPLMAAAHHGDADIVRALLEHGADPALRDDDDRTASDHAVGAAAHLLD
ncbi:MAG: ankyrin repeat domain-containing protein [Egibacteraceae bacterium]